MLFQLLNPVTENYKMLHSVLLSVVDLSLKLDLVSETTLPPQIH